MGVLKAVSQTWRPELVVVSFQVAPFKHQNPHHPLNFPSCCHSEILPTLCYLSRHLAGSIQRQIKRMGKRRGCGFHFILVNKDISCLLAHTLPLNRCACRFCYLTLALLAQHRLWHLRDPLTGFLCAIQSGPILVFLHDCSLTCVHRDEEVFLMLAVQLFSPWSGLTGKLWCSCELSE